jgi:hypothetical protein
MVAEFDASDEDEYLDEDLGTFRFLNLGLIVREDEEVDMVVAATVMNSVDGADNDDTNDWSIDLTGARTFDADGVAINEAISEPAATFEVVEEGDGDDLELRTSTQDPDQATIAVSEGDEEEVMIFAFELDADDSDGDVTLEEILLDVTGTVDTGGQTLEDFISDFRIEIDGDPFDAEDYDGNGLTEELEFDIDGDLEIEGGEAVTVNVYATFDVIDAFTGGTIMVSVAAADIDAEGAETITVGGTSVITSETHDVISEGIVVPADSVTTDTDTLSEGKVGEFTIEFDVTAFEDDFYITDNAGNSSSTVTDGVKFTVIGSGSSSAAVDATLTSTADENTTGVFTVEEGQTETFTLYVTVDPTVQGNFRVSLDEVIYSANADGTSTPQTRTLTPVSDYRTGVQVITAS